MTARPAFDKRDTLTCSQCYDFIVNGGRPACRRYGTIRYNPKQYGCGDYCCTDSGECELSYGTTLGMFL